ELEWSGSATAGDGAFPPPPVVQDITANACTQTPNAPGLYQLSEIYSESLLEGDIADYDFTLYESIADASDGINPIYSPNQPAGSFPLGENIRYMRVENQESGCFSIVEVI